jgi:hypothetical protein
MPVVDMQSGQEWAYLLTLMPTGFKALAKETQAIVRQRNIPDAASLLRIILAYSVSDLSLKDTAAWAVSEGVANITGPGLFYRLKESDEWLSGLLAKTLNATVKGSFTGGLRLRVVDATVVNGPGERSVDWRVHVVSEPSSGDFVAVEITDEHGGERFDIHDVKKGDIVVGDRAYGTARGLFHVNQSNGYVLARMNPSGLRVCGGDRKVFSLLDRAKDVPAVGGCSIDVIVPIPPIKKTKSHKTWNIKDAIAWIPARVVVGRTRGKELIWVLTTLPKSLATPCQVLDLYRLRWQIELFFKRLKTILGFDTLPSRKGPTARSWILGRLLAAALVQRLLSHSDAFSPWGYDIANATAWGS